MRTAIKIVLMAAMLGSMSANAVNAAQPRFPDDCGFAVGCNYWASHAGVYMWRDWNPERVARDFELLAASGMKVVRVFPLWPDFQPLTAELSGSGKLMGWGQNEGSLRNYAAVDDQMMERFRFVCDTAEKHGIKLIVGLVTGYMSGKLFVPQCLSFKNPITDPAALLWQTRFVRYFVSSLKNHPAIVAWDLGNECDNLGSANQLELYNWSLMIANEIRATDSSRPVISGMHGLSSDVANLLPIRLHSEAVDVLTTHPYPLWTPGCNTEPFDTLRNGCHAACETTYYAGMSGKPVFVEEAGSIGPGIASDERAARSMRAALFSCWAVGVKAFLWWCAFDQNRFNFAPYEWLSIERELGMYDMDGKRKPTEPVMREFTSFLESLPFKELPPRQIDATVIVSEREDTWAVAMGAWLLSRQAGFDIRYSLAGNPLPESKFYILPSGADYTTYPLSLWQALREKVRAGATLLVTLGNGTSHSEFEETIGARIESHYADCHIARADMGGDSFDIESSHRRILTPTTAKVLVRTTDGAPLFLENIFGKGKVLFFNAALEQSAALVGWPIYRLAATQAGVCRRVRSAVHTIGFTEHHAADGTTYVVAVNYAPKAANVKLSIDGTVGKVFGKATIKDGVLSLGANDGCVFELK